MKNLKHVQSISLIVPAVGPPKIGTIADLALNPILLLDEAVEVDGGGLEDPHGLRDGRRVLAKVAGSESTKAGLTAIRDVQGDPSGRFKPPVIDLI